jgi:hypothetical protein
MILFTTVVKINMCKNIIKLNKIVIKLFLNII